MHRVASLFAALLAAAVGAQKPPSSSELGKLVKSYLAEDGRSAASRTRQLEILERVALVPPLRDSAVKSWRKKLIQAWQKGRRLPPKNGEQHFWEEERKGRYIVGGKTARPKGLLIAMHGGGAGSGDARSAHATYDSAADKLGWLSISPEVLDKTEHGWTDSGSEEFVVDLIDAARRTWRIDADRVYLAGHSMGGYGSWTLGAHHADRVAAVAPSAGAPTPIMRLGSEEIIDIVEGVIPSLRNVYVACFQSADDPRVPPGPNRVAVAKLKEAAGRWGGYEHDYWEVDGVGHGLPPGGIGELLDKIAPRQRDPRPRKLVWQPVLDWKRQFYWLHWERPQANAIVVAEYDPTANQIRVECADASGMSVLLDPGMFDPKRDVVVKRGDQVVFSGKPEAHLATLLLTAPHGDPGRMFAYRVPLDGAK